MNNPYFNVVTKGGYGIGDFASLDEAKRYCEGESVGKTPPLNHDALRIEEWSKDPDGIWSKTANHKMN